MNTHQLTPLQIQQQQQEIAQQVQNEEYPSFFLPHQQQPPSSPTSQQQQQQPQFKMDQCLQLFDHYHSQSLLLSLTPSSSFIQQTQQIQQNGICIIYPFDISTYTGSFYQYNNNNNNYNNNNNEASPSKSLSYNFDHYQIQQQQVQHQQQSTKPITVGFESIMNDCGIHDMFDMRYYLFMYKLFQSKNHHHYQQQQNSQWISLEQLINDGGIVQMSRTDWMFLMYRHDIDSLVKLRHWVQCELNRETSQWTLVQVKHFMHFVFQLLILIEHSSSLLLRSNNSRSGHGGSHSHSKEVAMMMMMMMANHKKVINARVAARALYGIMRDRSIFTESFCRFLMTSSSSSSSENDLYSSSGSSSGNNYSNMTRDQWMVFIDWSMTVKSDFSNYDPNDSWPSLYDSYVSHVLASGR